MPLLDKEKTVINTFGKNYSLQNKEPFSSNPDTSKKIEL